MFHPTKSGRSVIRVAAATLIALSLGLPQHTQASTPLPSTGALFGAYVQPDTGWARPDIESAVLGFEEAIGRTLDIDQHFYPWNSATPFPTWRETWDREQGRSSLVTWGTVPTSEVNAGTHDAAITARADAVAAFGSPLLVRWFAEMDGTYNAGKTGSPAAYVAAWRRIHGIFAQRGTTNVAWVWCPTAWGFTTGDAQQYYPGDAYVDWVCADGYNWAPGRPDASWTSFRDVFASFYAWGSATGKPLMVGETGTEERAPGEKAQWITDMGAALKADYPRIKALVYFDALRAEPDGTFDWRYDTSPSSAQATRTLAQDPYFLGLDDGSVPGDDGSLPSGGEGAATIDAGFTSLRNRKVKVTWAVPDDQAVVERHVYDHRGRLLVQGSWEAAPTSELRFRGKPGRGYCFTVGGTQGLSGAEEACAAVPLNDRALRRRGAWDQVRHPKAYMRSASVSTVRGASLVSKPLRATQISIVATTCPRCGSFSVRIGKKRLGTVSLRSKTRRARVVDLPPFHGVRSGRLLLRVLSQGKPVTVEGVAVTTA